MFRPDHDDISFTKSENLDNIDSPGTLQASTCRLEPFLLAT